MSKERLEEIKNGTYLFFVKHKELKKDMDWLIEQAERVQELEETVEDYKAVNKELHQRGRKLRKQNKRYREALEFYADERNYKERDFGMIVQPAIQDGDKGETARKALEGEE